MGLRIYFELQVKMLGRWLSDAGLPPIWGALGAAVGFAGGSVYLFSQLDYAEYVYCLIAWWFALQLSLQERNDFLKICFPGTGYLRIRALENLAIALPFAAFLLIKTAYAAAAGLTLGAVALGLLRLPAWENGRLPTPFFRRPFEFIVGFRGAIWLVLCSWVLTGIAVQYDNFGLGVFALLVNFLLSMTFYTRPESKYLVWIHSVSPGAFLRRKIQTALIHGTLLCLPVTLSLLTFFSDHALLIAGVHLLGLAYLAMMVLAKYSAFPMQISLPQTIMIAISLWFPPLLIGIIPFFYVQAVKRLQEVLI